MAQHGSNDQSNNAPIWASELVNKTVNTANRDALYQNTTADAFVTNTTKGVFGVDATELLTAKAPHTGWVLRTVGTGNRAGRVQYEVLVAGGIITDDSGDTVLDKLYQLVFDTQPSNTSSNSSANAVATFTTAAHSNPPGASLSYQWQYHNGSAFVNVTANATYSNVTTATLYVANTTGLDNTRFQVFVSAANAATITSSSVYLTVTT